MGKDYIWKESENDKQLKLLRKVSEETRLSLGYFMFIPGNKLIKAARKREVVKENSSFKNEVVSMMDLIERKWN